MDLLWCIKYESCKKNDLGQPHGQREAHLQGGHHEWHVYPVLWGKKLTMADGSSMLVTLTLPWPSHKYLEMVVD